METLRVILLVTCGQGGQPSYQLAYHHRRCSVKKVVLRNFAKFTGKHLCQSLFFKKVAGLRPATLLKKRLSQVFSCEFFEITKNTFSTEHFRATASVDLSYVPLVGLEVISRLKIVRNQRLIDFEVILPNVIHKISSYRLKYAFVQSDCTIF